ncbi:MAG: alpha/beta hydrolase, partial [Mycobacterium sp.]
MAVDLGGVTTVLLPGTGSDDDYVYRAFAPALHKAGAVVVTPPPQPDRLIDGYLSELDDAARPGAIAVGGVSLGAAVAVAWALAHPARAVAVLAALPAWTGSPEIAPAAQAARHSAQM